MDIEFISQYLQLIFAEANPGVFNQNTFQALKNLRLAGQIDPAEAKHLQTSLRLIQTLEQIIRLCFTGPFDPKMAPGGLEELLTKVAGEITFNRLEYLLWQALTRHQQITIKSWHNFATFPTEFFQQHRLIVD